MTQASPGVPGLGDATRSSSSGTVSGEKVKGQRRNRVSKERRTVLSTEEIVKKVGREKSKGGTL